MTDLMNEELLLINCFLYDENFLEDCAALMDEKKDSVNTNPVTILDWANWQKPELLDPTGNPGDTTREDWEHLIATIQANPEVYGNMEIHDPRQRESGANMATFVYNGKVIVGFEGTRTPEGPNAGIDWMDNGVGTYGHVTDTPFQQEALDYYQEMLDKHARVPIGEGQPDQWKDVVVTGHSKGGNLSDYCAIVGLASGYPAPESYSFDGQGFNDAFQRKYADQIAQLQSAGAFHHRASGLDFVGLLMYGMDPHRSYTTGVAHDIDHFGTNHSPWAMWRWNEETGQLEMPADGPQAGALAFAAGFVDHLFKFLAFDDRQKLAELAMGIPAGTVNLDQIVMPPELWAAIAGSEVSQGRQVTVGDFFFGEYGELIDKVLALGAAYAESIGVEPWTIILLLGRTIPGLGDKIIEIITHPATAIPLVPQAGIAAIAAANAYLKAQGDTVPFSSVVRDFSEQVLERLLEIIAVTEEPPDLDVRHWEVYRRVEDLLHGLGFPENSARITEYYDAVTTSRWSARNRIIQIFSGVYTEDQSFATMVESSTADIHQATQDLRALDRITTAR